MATGNLPRGYDYEFVDHVDRRFFCVICEMPFKDAVQTKCGHKFCHGCLIESMRRFNNGCPIDRILLDINRDVFSDVSTQREIMDLQVKCKGPSCDWVGDLREAETHIEKCTNTNCDVRLIRPNMKKHVEDECEWRSVSCGFCSARFPKREEKNHHNECHRFPLRCTNGCEKDRIPRSEMQDHLDKECPLTDVPCLYLNVGCRERFERRCLNQHIKSSMGRHLNLACNKITTLEKSQTETEAQLRKLEYLLEAQRKKQTTLHTKLIWPIQDFMALIRKSSFIYSPDFYSWDHGYKLKLLVYPNGFGYGKGSHLSIFVVVTKGEFDTILPWPFNRRVKISLLNQKQDEKDHLMKIVDFNEATSDYNEKPVTERNKGWGNNQFISHQELTNSPYLVDDTIYLEAKVIDDENKYIRLVWPVERFNSLQTKNSAVYSPLFYSWEHGYKMKLQVYPNGVAGGKGTHLSVLVVITKGEYDAILPWPFNRNVMITLLSQNRDKEDDLVKSLDFSEAPLSLKQRSTGERTEGYGKTYFISHTMLANSSYLVNGTIFLQVKVF